MKRALLFAAAVSLLACSSAAQQESDVAARIGDRAITVKELDDRWKADDPAVWEYHDRLFANQEALQPSDLRKYAADLRLDRAMFDACLDSSKHGDPQVLGNRGARFIAWSRMPGEHVLPYECDPSFAVNYGK